MIERGHPWLQCPRQLSLRAWWGHLGSGVGGGGSDWRSWVRRPPLGQSAVLGGGGYLTGCGCDAGPSAGLGTREAPPPSRITQGGGTGVPSSGPVILQCSESRLETLVAHRVVQRTGAGGEAATCLAQPWGWMFVSLPFLLQVSLPRDPSALYSLGTF